MVVFRGKKVTVKKTSPPNPGKLDILEGSDRLRKGRFLVLPTAG